MIFRLMVLAFGTLWLGTPLAAIGEANANADAHQAILAIYQKQHQGYFRKDVTAELSGVYPAFVSKTVLGTKFGYAYERKHMQSVFDNVTPSEWENQRTSWVIGEFVFKGNQATVKVRSHFAVQSISLQTKRPYYQSVDEVVVDRWDKTSHGWVETQEQFLSSQHTHSLARLN